MNKTTIAAVALLLLAGMASAGPPETRNDFGDANFGLEPNPPAVEPPAFEPPEADLGTVLEIVFENVDAGTTHDINILQSGAPLFLDIAPDGEMVGRLVTNSGVLDFTLPPLNADEFPDDIDPDSPELDFSVIYTLATLSIDRAGTNPPNVEPDDIKDATFNIWGLLDKLPPMAAYDDPDLPEITLEQDPKKVVAEKLGDGDITAIRVPVAIEDAVEKVIKTVFIDPESVMTIGPIADAIAVPDILAQDQVATAEDIEAKLSQGITGLSLDSVLSSLSSATEEFGAVDVANLAQAFVDLGFTVTEIDSTLGDKAGINFDPTTADLAIIDGGLGKIAMLSGEEDLNFDDDLVTDLKDTESVADTRFLFLDADTLGEQTFAPELGNYEDLMFKVQELSKNGIDYHHVINPEDCSSKVVQADLQVCGIANADITNIGADHGRFLAKITRASEEFNLALAPDDSRLKKLLVTPEANFGVLDGKLGGFPAFDLDPSGFDPNIAADPDLPDTGGWWQLDTPEANLNEYRLPQFHKPGWKLPDNGLGALDDVESPNANLPDAPELNCTGSCIPSTPPVLYDAILEGFQAPAAPGLGTLVPVSETLGSVGFITDLAGNGMAFAPLDLLEKLPAGLTSAMTFRAIGESGSIFSNQGIPGATVQVSYTDPLGMATRSASQTTNANGYAPFAFPSLGDYTVTLTKVGFEPSSGSGTAPPPGQSGGQQYVMTSSSDSAARDFVANNSLWFIFVGIALLGYLWWAKQNNKFPFGRRRK